MRTIPPHVTALQRESVRSGRLRLGLGQCRIRQDACAGATRAAAFARRRAAGENFVSHLYQGGRRQYAERVFKALSTWTAFDDVGLAKALAEIGAPKIDAGPH